MLTPEQPPSWRDIADQLTAEQRASFARTEHELSGTVPEAQAREILLGYARDDAQTNLADACYGDVLAPTGATVAGRWMRERAGGGWVRPVEWASFELVGVDGWQHTDGTAAPEISLYIDEGTKLSAAAARELAAQLLAAADVAEQL